MVVREDIICLLLYLPMGTTLLGVIAILLLIYLIATMIYPEKF